MHVQQVEDLEVDSDANVLATVLAYHIVRLKQLQKCGVRLAWFMSDARSAAGARFAWLLVV